MLLLLFLYSYIIIPGRKSWSLSLSLIQLITLLIYHCTCADINFRCHHKSKLSTLVLCKKMKKDQCMMSYMMCNGKFIKCVSMFFGIKFYLYANNTTVYWELLHIITINYDSQLIFVTERGIYHSLVFVLTLKVLNF